MSLLQTIKSRGYWEVEIRPSRFDAKRVESLRDLAEIVAAKRVELRGWDFPHLSRDEPSAGADFVAQEVDALSHVESWRFYLSGLFVHFRGVSADWIERNDLWHRQTGGRIAPGQVLGVGDTAMVFAELFEFASRLAMSKAGAEQMRVDITLHRAKGRVLWMDAPGRSLSPRPALVAESVAQGDDFSRERLVGESRLLAMSYAQECFRRFGWDAPIQVVSELQNPPGFATSQRSGLADQLPEYDPLDLKHGDYDPFDRRPGDYDPFDPKHKGHFPF